jgi:hypothetical protein
VKASLADAYARKCEAIEALFNSAHVAEFRAIPEQVRSQTLDL